MFSSEFQVICAGYEDEMDAFFESNPGFKLEARSSFCWVLLFCLVFPLRFAVLFALFFGKVFCCFGLVFWVCGAVRVEEFVHVLYRRLRS